MAVTEAGRIPQRVNLKLYAGDSETFQFADDSVDVTVGQWTAQIRPEGSTAVEAFAVAVVDGELALSVDAATSQRLGTYKQNLRWDLQQTFDDFNVTTHVGGLLLVTQDVTPVGEARPAPPPPPPPPPPADLFLLVTEDGSELLTESSFEMVIE